MKVKQPVPLPKLTKKAQDIFNKWIRTRDADKPCITCGRYKIENACHFYPAGVYTALRFNEDNVHGGCVQCNYYKHGETNFYRKHLPDRIGEQRLNLLDAAARTKTYKWSRFELEMIIDKYKLPK